MVQVLRKDNSFFCDSSDSFTKFPNYKAYVQDCKAKALENRKEIETCKNEKKACEANLESCKVTSDDSTDPNLVECQSELKRYIL